MDKIDFIQDTILERGAYLQGDYVNIQNCMRLLARKGMVVIPNNNTAFRNLYMRYGYFNPFYMCNGAIKGFVASNGNIHLEINKRREQ